jgi:hypothetical protein
MAPEIRMKGRSSALLAFANNSRTIWLLRHLLPSSLTQPVGKIGRQPDGYPITHMPT